MQDGPLFFWDGLAFHARAMGQRFSGTVYDTLICFGLAQ
jgi:hypothetical protein